MKKKLATLLLCLLTCSLAFGAFAQEGASSDPIKVGISAPLTGNSAEYGKSITAAVKLAADEVNANGGVQGRQIELVMMDSKADAKETADVARIFTGDPEIVAVIGDFNSTCSMSAAPIYQEAGLVMLNPTAGHPDIPATGNYIFATMGRQSDEGPFVARQLVGQFLGAKTAGVLYVNNDWGVLATKGFVSVSEESGFKVVAQENIVEGEKDFSTALNKIRQTNPDVLVMMLQHTECSMASKQVRQMGWEVPLVTAGASYTEQLIKLGGQDVEGILSESPFIIEETDDMAMEFSRKIEEEIGFAAGIHAAGSYDAAALLFAAMGQAKTLDRDGIRDALEAYTGFSGLMGPIEFDEVGGVTRKYRILTITDGKWIPLTGYDYY